MDNNLKTKTVAIGAVLGMITGVIASFILINQAEKRQESPRVSPADGVKLGLGVFTLLRLVSDITNRD